MRTLLPVNVMPLDKFVFFVSETLPLMIILVGVTSGIIIFSAFVALLVYCHRKSRQKSDKVKEKPDVTVTSGDYRESDRSSNISDLKMQMANDGNYDLVSIIGSWTCPFLFFTWSHSRISGRIFKFSSKYKKDTEELSAKSLDSFIDSSP